MVEEVINPNIRTKSKTTRPRPVYLWNVLDVQKWLRRHCSDYYQLYYELFLHICRVIKGSIRLLIDNYGCPILFQPITMNLLHRDWLKWNRATVNRYR
ncbi:PREDICTED: uncharacterized protein LOC105155079 isoform X2 [Acromyrmex echinatior]|uniref:uncharacterized protein LOC105155079 isoform X2 n=1 Tax=Acromyrmex echinatior TaxID=103372 RepID=UPI000580D18D|nr:PREDICTED: uncharacterized protein LOC105155079 isoform X2 [Acromyrmex echinatior]